MRTSPAPLARTVLAMAFCSACSPCPGGDGPGTLYLSDAQARGIVTSTQGWGELGLDTAVRPVDRTAAPLRIKDRVYRRGLGHHAPGEIVVDLEGQFQSFQAELGIQWQGGNTAGSVVFQVYVDGRKLFDSGVVHESDLPRAVSVAVSGAQELRLVATDAGDGITCDCADWADARLTRDPAAKPSDLISVDVAPFGRNMSWDPARKTGTTASRVDEFPRADIEPGRELLADSDGMFRIAEWNGRGCIGIQWYESRTLRQVALEFADAASVPTPESIDLEFWRGDSAWQGRWEPIKTRCEKQGTRLSWLVEGPAAAYRTPKVRWCIPVALGQLRVKAASAFTRSRWRPIDLKLESTSDGPARRIPIELYNGVFAESSGDSAHHRNWDSSRPLAVRVIASVPRVDKTDRTVLRIGLPESGFGVAVEDVLERREVSYAGIRVLCTGRRSTEATSSGSSETVLSQVRKRPDQTLDQALAIVHKPIQDLGPMMLSLACDNRKLVVDRDGTVRFDTCDGPGDPPRAFLDQWRLEPQWRDRANLKTGRHLHGGWLPIPVSTFQEGAVVYRQRTFVAPVDEPKPGLPPWTRDRALGVVEFTVTNEGQATAPARLRLGIAGAAKASVESRSGTGLNLVTTGGRVLAVLDARAAGPLKVQLEPSGLGLDGHLPPGREARSIALIPMWKMRPGEESALLSETSWSARTEAYWNALLEPAMRVELPNVFLTNLIRASQVHCLLAARSDADGQRVAPWISADRYGPLESEAHAVIRGMDLVGQTEFARRSLEFFISRYDPRGFLTTGYTLVGTGEHLWTLAEHYERTRDRAWIKKIAPDLLRVCSWIVAQRAKTKRLDAHGRKVPEFGLMPPGVTADWNRFAYRFFNDAQYCAGLTAIARVLADCGHSAAAGLGQAARQYQEDLLTAYHWTQARSPVLRLGSGTWALAQPALLDSFGRVEEFLPGEDGNRTWAYSVEIGAHHLAALGILDPRSTEVSAMLEYLEDFQFLRSGMGEYAEETNRQDRFNLGGFAKVQPFYARVAEVYALRDEVKPFVRSYFNGLSSLVSRETLSFWEHFHNQGGWNKTHETGWFLCQTRMMLVQERGTELWLAPMVTDRWLKEGKVISVENAPTRFGKVGYTIRRVSGGHSIDARIVPPAAPSGLGKIVIRVRHPEGRSIHAVTVSGHPHSEFRAADQTITLPPAVKPFTVQIDY